ncbi:coiled-coil domain containing 169 isoform X1 [Astyanax mexicanus]|uniref:Coiled-coil domain-containing protein 169-like isoform X1 n=1 Tax=Astyanax mexicanus TaxID=7994 RepID=A0A8T2L0Y4_ASTMX|nr:coiled-coil domain containing 169 isoform X1 [Astyanax mexicanus]KAG9263705.1 coiled-coil domain-containing protein 169-like isoform X1 [Astyanax mexicanus]
MGDSDLSRYDLSRLQAELEQEREVKEMLVGSVSDLRSTLTDLEQRLHSVEGEGNEWRTRYETQLELNGQLERQIGVVQEKLEGLSGNPMDRLASIRSYDEMTVDALRQRLKLLSTEKTTLQNQLLEYRLRIDQEGKAYQKAYDERRAYLTEIAKVSSAIDLTRKQHLNPEKRRIQGTQRDSEGRRGPARADFTQSRLPRLKR